MKTGFIGLGLIGGSIARAVRHFYPDAEIIAYSRCGRPDSGWSRGGFRRLQLYIPVRPGFQQRKISGTVEAPHPLFLHHHRRRKYQDRHPRKSYGTWYGRKLYRWTSHGRF